MISECQGAHAKPPLQLLQRTYPGQFPALRRDVHNVVIPLDLTNLQDTEMLVETLQMFVKRQIPIRFGIVPIVGSESAVRQAGIVYYLLDAYGLGTVVAYLEKVSIELQVRDLLAYRSSVGTRKEDGCGQEDDL